MKLTGQILKEQRLAMGVSQDEMARRVGATRQTIMTYEKGVNSLAARLIEAYGLGVYPVTGPLAADIGDIERMVKKLVKDSLGADCRVKINVEFLGDEE